MGEAKRRGSQTERVEAAIGAVPSPEAMRESMGFAASAKFVGYVVHLPDSDEFLADAMVSQRGVTVYRYGANPDLAKVFADYRGAAKQAAQIQKHRTVVAYLFDHDNQWLVGFTD